MAKRDLVAGVLLLLFGIFFGSVALSYGYTYEYGPGAGFAPFWLSVILCILAVVLILKSAIALRRVNQDVAKKDIMFRNPLVIASCLGILFMVSLLMERAGFVISVGLAIILNAKVAKSDYPWKKAVLLGVVSSVVIYVAFKFGLGINLPKGVLPI